MGIWILFFYLPPQTIYRRQKDTDPSQNSYLGKLENDKYLQLFFLLGGERPKIARGGQKMPHRPRTMVIFCKVIIFCLFETRTNRLKYMDTCLGSCTLERKTVAFSCQRQLQQPDIQSALAHGHFCPWQLAYGRNLPRAVCSTPNFPTRSFSSHPSLWTDELHSTCIWFYMPL